MGKVDVEYHVITTRKTFTPIQASLWRNLGNISQGQNLSGRLANVNISELQIQVIDITDHETNTPEIEDQINVTNGIVCRIGRSQLFKSYMLLWIAKFFSEKHSVGISNTIFLIIIIIIITNFLYDNSVLCQVSKS